MTKIKSKATRRNPVNKSLLPESVTFKTLGKELDGLPVLISAFGAGIKQAELTEKITDVQLSVLYDFMASMVDEAYNLTTWVFAYSLFDSRLRKRDINLEHKDAVTDPMFLAMCLNDLVRNCPLENEHSATLRSLRNFLIGKILPTGVLNQFEKLLA